MNPIKFITHPIFLLTFLAFLTVIPFFNTRFFYTQDYIFIARLSQISAALLDGQFPVRWAPDLRFGEPVFNFYAALPYYLGALIHLLGFNIIWVAKILFILSAFLSALAIYVFTRKFFSTKAAIFAAILYIYAPYRAVDTYVRGTLSENWAFVFFPLIFYTSALLAEKISLARIAFLSLSLAGLFLTHNVTTLMFLPFLGLWWLFLIFKNGNIFSRESINIEFSFIFSFLLGIGVSAFFLLPAFFERKFIQTEYLTVGYFDFRAHFIALKQFFSTFWGYGSSLWGLDDGISFQIGLAHWLVILLAVITGFINRNNRKLLMLLFFLGVSFLLSLFLQHNKSAPIWEAIPLMAFIQFPWRFLAVSIFIVSITGAVVIDSFLNKSKYLYLLLIGLVIAVNFSYFKPKDYVDDSFFAKFLDKDIMHKGIDLTKDYLPIWVETVDVDYFDKPRSQEGEIEVLESQRRSDYLKAKTAVKSDNSIIELPITYFPGWEVKLDNKLISQLEPSVGGLIRIELPKGVYNIEARFNNTPIRLVGNSLTVASLLLVTFFLGYTRYKLK